MIECPDEIELINRARELAILKYIPEFISFSLKYNREIETINPVVIDEMEAACGKKYEDPLLLFIRYGDIISTRITKLIQRIYLRFEDHEKNEEIEQKIDEANAGCSVLDDLGGFLSSFLGEQSEIWNYYRYDRNQRILDLFQESGFDGPVPNDFDEIEYEGKLITDIIEEEQSALLEKAWEATQILYKKIEELHIKGNQTIIKLLTIEKEYGNIATLPDTIHPAFPHG